MRGYVFPQNVSFVGSLHGAFPALPAPDPGAGGGGQTTVTVAAGSNKIVYYRPPNNYFFGPSSIRQQIKITASSGGIDLGDTTVDLIRPTIVLNHGFGAGPGHLQYIESVLLIAADVRVLRLDWENINTSGIDTVPIRLHNKILEELDFQRGQKVAATRIDTFGHSAGGVIVKWYASDIANTSQARGDGFSGLVWSHAAAPYRRADNFGVGGIRRFVSVGSPFQGSPFGDQASTVLGYDGVNFIVANAADWGLSLGGDAAAFNDFGRNGTAMVILSSKHPQISWFPIVGIGAPGKTEEDLGGIFVTLLDLLNSTSTALGLLAANSDFVVRDISQVDRAIGAFPPAGVSHQVVPSVTHLDEQDSSLVIAEIRWVLDLHFNDPSEPGYTQGYTRFNAGF